MNIVVLAGGLSMERDISLASGCQISNALIEAGHRVFLLDAYLGYEIKGTEIDRIFSDQKIQTCEIPIKPPTLEMIKTSRSGANDGYFGPNVLKICRYADVVFIALHGADGENGKIQATFDLLGISYTGSDYQGALFALNKDISKKLMRSNNILTADWKLLKKSDYQQNYIPDNFPVVIKPTYEGSSIGVSIVHNAQELTRAIETAFSYGDSVIVEKFIAGREFSVGILNQLALPPIEIIPKTGFFDYKNKYQANCTEEICPAELSLEQEAELQTIALNVHSSLCLGVYARIDFIQDFNGRFYCLEANTLPGMTPESLLPKESYAAGYTFSELCDEIVQHAVKNNVRLW